MFVLTDRAAATECPGNGCLCIAALKAAVVHQLLAGNTHRSQTLCAVILFTGRLGFSINRVASTQNITISICSIGINCMTGIVEQIVGVDIILYLIIRVIIESIDCFADIGVTNINSCNIRFVRYFSGIGHHSAIIVERKIDLVSIQNIRQLG